VPRDGPADVYSEIAAIVRSQVQQHASEYDGSADADIDAGADLSRIKPDDLRGYVARMLEPHVSGKSSRKIVKQTVMTSVYGVTHIGAKDQIKRQLVDINDEAKSLHARGGPLVGFIDERFLSYASTYLAQITMATISNEFVSAKNIMKWLQELCRVASRLNDQPVMWLTPLGLPICQPYSKKPSKLIRSALQVCLAFSLFISSGLDELDVFCRLISRLLLT